MKRLLLLMALALPCMAQTPVFLQQAFNTQTAATPTFSPAAGGVANPTTVTPSTATGPCSAYMYVDSSNPPATLQLTYTVTTGITLYAQIKGCPGYNNSGIASATYSIVTAYGVLHETEI